MAQIPFERDESSTKRAPENASLESIRDFISSLPTREGWSQPLVLYKDYWFRPQFLENIFVTQDFYKPCSDDIILATQPKYRVKCFNMFSGGFSPYEYWRASLERPEKVMFLKYEEIQSDPVLVVRKLAGFLGVPFSKQEEIGGIPEIGKLTRRVADWVNHITEDMGKKLDCIVQEKLRGSGLSFLDRVKCFNMFSGGFSPYEYWRASLERPEKVMFLKYEEIQSDPVLVVRKLAGFLGVPFSKQEEIGGIPEIGKLTRRVADWVNHITEDMGKKLDCIVQEKLRGSGLSL
uniref:Sulfotransferase n=1 Tax=Leersia perrieri TaxID=77586 RepID=A0A0D9XBQ2_9ORYZ